MELGEREFFKRIGLCIVIALVFIIPFCILVINKYDNNTSGIKNKIEKEENVLLFVDGYKCNECKKIKKILKENNIKYISLNKDTENANYKIIMSNISLDEKFAPAPSLILASKGELVTNINDFDSVDLNKFFEEYDLY